MIITKHVVKEISNYTKENISRNNIELEKEIKLINLKFGINLVSEKEYLNTLISCYLNILYNNLIGE